IRTGSFTGTRTFPLGEGNYYMPATLSSIGTNDFNVAVFSGAASNGAPNGSAFANLSPIVNANWIIDRNSGTTATDITFSWSESLEGAAFSVAADNEIGISRYDGSAWDPIVGVNGDNNGNSVTRTGVNTFSPFIVAVLNTPLPLKFGNISAARKKQVVNVQWEALSEDNVALYEVQKSSNGLSFNKAGVVNALANTLPSYKYGWIDASPGNGNVFYRIKAVDNDGKYQYSSVVKVAPENPSGGIKVYPNPVQANGRINLEAGVLSEGIYRIELMDMSGVRVYTRTLEHAGGSLTQNMELSKSMKPGTYILKFSGENVTYTSTILMK
ncbi:MAG: T9SS type A sorting domain-containing protein, partial [Bacteroidota bacterium]